MTMKHLSEVVDELGRLTRRVDGLERRVEERDKGSQGSVGDRADEQPKKAAKSTGRKDQVA